MIFDKQMSPVVLVYLEPLLPFPPFTYAICFLRADDVKVCQEMFIGECCFSRVLRNRTNFSSVPVAQYSFGFVSRPKDGFEVALAYRWCQWCRVGIPQRVS